jgi:hypothetical protein
MTLPVRPPQGGSNREASAGAAGADLQTESRSSGGTPHRIGWPSARLPNGPLCRSIPRLAREPLLRQARY